MEFNFLLYITKLSEYVGHPSTTGRGTGATLPNYSITNRSTWYTNTGVGGFVAIRSVASATEITWWPLTYDDNNVTDIISRNDS